MKRPSRAGRFVPDFDLTEATLEAARLTGRLPLLEEASHE